MNRIKKKQFVSLCLFAAIFFAAPVLSAKCFSFRNGGDIRVCVQGNDTKARGQASTVCKSIKGSDCGAISGYSGSCSKGNSARCFDASGKENKKLSSD